MTTAIYFVGSLLFTILMQKLFIDKLSKTRFFAKTKNVELIKKTCIKELHKDKQNTPTMGGIFINLAFLIFTIVYSIIKKEFLWMNLILLLFGIMGFIDDYLKLKQKRDGVTPKEKLFGLIIISTIIAASLYLPGEIQMAIPFVNTTITISSICYALFSIFLLVAASNSMNITDGLDGLALGICSIVFSFISIVAYKVENYDVLYGSITLLASCLATLIFNIHPAKIFIGDTGSLFLGGIIAFYLIALEIPIWIIILLGVCVFETVSVILQLSSLKLFNKKIFTIAPFHHHLEKSGWKETTVVYTFWAITLCLTIIGYLGLHI